MNLILKSFVLVTCITASTSTKGYILPDLVFVSREEWNAKPPKQVDPMPNPVPYVIIHHSYQPAACSTPEACIKAMQSMQNYHQKTRGWNDIGYSFAVGGDNRAYVGRGWSAVGAHAPLYNQRSIGICIIGDWTEKLPPQSQLEVVKNLIKYGVNHGKISPDYVLLGHRQVRDTLCPGDALFNEIQNWPNWIPNPPNNPELMPTVNSGARGMRM